MATINAEFLLSNVGALWPATFPEFVAWLGYLGGTLTHSLGNAKGLRRLRITRTTALDTFITDYYPLNLRDSQVVGISELAGQPGWGNRPPLLDSTQPLTKVPHVEWRAHWRQIRYDIWSTWAEAAIQATTSGDIANLDFNYDMYWDYWGCRNQLNWAVDALLIYVKRGASITQMPGNVGPVPPIPSFPASPGVDAGAGISAIAEQLEIMNNTTTELSLNHGQTIFSVKGGSVIG